MDKKLKVKFAPMPITDTSYKVLVKIIHPIESVEYLISMHHIPIFLGDTSIESALKERILSDWHTRVDELGKLPKVTTWMADIDSVELIECDLLTLRSGNGEVNEKAREEVFSAISSERDYQNIIWDNNNKSSNATSISAYILWMERYLHVARELASTTDETTGTESADAIMDTIRKVAGLAVSCGEIHGMPSRVIKGEVQ